MNSDRNEELGILRQSYKMYENTREEMKRMNRPTDMIDNEMKQIEARIVALMSDERLEVEKENKETVVRQLPKYENVQKIIDNINKGNTIELDNAVIDETPVRLNHFIVHFPSEYNIKPYAIDGIVPTDSELYVSIREFEDENPILPLRLNKMKEKRFDIKVDILRSDKTIYYTVIYKECKLNEDIFMPSLSYNNSGIIVWNLSFSHEKIEYEP